MNGKYWDRAWSLVDGCKPCSPGCENCWSAALMHRFYKHPCDYDYSDSPIGLTAEWKPVFTGKIILHPERLNAPLKRKKPTVWSIWNDLFHDGVPLGFIDDVLDVISACPQHTFLALTKRAHLIEDKLYDNTPECGIRNLGGGDYLGNFWVGVTVCNQQEADIKIPMLLESWPGKKWLSIEPMLGPVSIEEYCMGFDPYWTPDRDDDGLVRLSDPGIHWIVCGGETGPHARPIHRNWVRSIRDQCATAGVPFFFKQWGEWVPSHQAESYYTKGKEIIFNNMYFRKVGKKAAGRLLDGREHNDLPWRMIH